MDPFSIRTNAQLGVFLQETGAKTRSLGRTVFDEPIWVARLGGDKLPAIVITAGSHADEVAGVFAALCFVLRLDCDHAIYVIPCRDPNGWNGFAATLRRTLPDAPAVTAHDEAARVLRSADVYFDTDELVIARVGSMVFASAPASDWTSTKITRHMLPSLLASEPHLAATLRQTRIMLPGNVAAADGRDPYGYGGHTAYVGDGYAAQLNRFFDRPDAPVEVNILRDFVDRIRPGLTLDLHEGFSDGYYLFITAADSGATTRMAQAMVDAVRKSGGRIATREELEPIWCPETSAGILTVSNGVFTLGPPSSGPQSSFAGYCEQFGLAITTEPGMEAAVSVRVAAIDAGARAVIDQFAAMHA